MDLKKMKQKDAVVRYMKENGSITSLEASNDLGVSRLAAVIHSLKKDGININTRSEKVKTRYCRDAVISRYSIGD